jgi:hypothetical protein
MNTTSYYHITLQLSLLLINVGWEFDFDTNIGSNSYNIVELENFQFPIIPRLLEICWFL